MADLNEVRLIGRLTRDPVLRTIPSGTQLATFGLATSHKYKDQGGVMREDTCFVDITVWGRLAEIVCQYIKKGSPIYVGGRLRLESWDDKQSGQKRSKLTVVADNIQFLGNKSDNGNAQPQGQTPAAPATNHTFKEVQPGQAPETNQWPEMPIDPNDQPPF